MKKSNTIGEKKKQPLKIQSSKVLSPLRKTAAKVKSHSVDSRQTPRAETIVAPIAAANLEENSQSTVLDLEPSQPLKQLENSPGPPLEKKELGKAGKATVAADNVSSIVEKAFQGALPRYELNPPPKYPEVARRRGLAGTVVLEVAVRADGRVNEVILKESSGYRSLDRSAIRTVRRWLFKPATSTGFPIASRVEVPIDFNLDN
jgi:protein TonB